MEFKIIGLDLQATAKTSHEVRELVDFFKLDVTNHIDALTRGEMSHTLKASQRDSGQWFAVSQRVGAEWFAPYAALLTKWTGYEGEVPRIECQRYPGHSWAKNLQHTHIVTVAEMGSFGFEFHGFQHGSAWNNQIPEAYANRLFAQYVRAGLGHTESEPEYIRLGNGLLRENPNYLKRHAPKPRATAAEVFDSLLQWWLASEATPGQRQIVADAIACHNSVCKTDSLGSWLIREYSGTWRTSWEGSPVSMDQFKAA